MFFLIFGEDSFRSKRKLSALRERFLETRDHSGINYVVYDSDKNDVSTVRQAIFATPFLAEKKLLMLRGFLSCPKNEQEEIQEALSKKPESTIVVFYETKGKKDLLKSSLFTLLQEQKFTEEFPLLKGVPLHTFLQEEAKTFECYFETRAIVYFAELLSSDVWRMHTELKKICTFAKLSGQQKITEAMVEEILNDKKEISVFACIDAYSAGRHKEAVTLCEQLLNDGVSEIQLTALLYKQIKVLLVAEDAISQNKKDVTVFARMMNIHPYVAEKAFGKARQLNKEKLKSELQSIFQIEQNAKSGKGDVRTSLYAFLSGVL